jgi:hypothetical protein
MKDPAYLFLDMDGVLNGIYDVWYTFSNDSNAIRENRWNNPDTLHWMPNGYETDDCVSAHKLKLLKRMILDYNIRVINISSWVCRNNSKDTESYNKFVGFELYGNIFGGERSLEILNYIVENNVKRFVILDDDGRCYRNHPNHAWYKNKPYANLLAHFVQPHGRYGINEQHIEECLSILGEVTSKYSQTFPARLIQEVNNVFATQTTLDFNSAISAALRGETKG